MIVSETMIFRGIVFVFYQCLLLCGNTVSSGTLIRFGKNIRPARIYDKDRVVLAPSSSRLRCFAKCARDPRCSKCVRYDTDGTDEEVVKEVLNGWEPHSDDYLLKCATVTGKDGRSSGTDRSHSDTPSSQTALQNVIDKSASLIPNIKKYSPSAHDIKKPSPPSRHIDKSTTAMLDTKNSSSTSQDVQKSVPTSQDVQKSVPTSQDVKKLAPTSQDVQKSAPTSQDVQKSTPTSQDVKKSKPASSGLSDIFGTAFGLVSGVLGK